MSAKIEPLRKPVACPSCKGKSEREYYPFCSKRCCDKDLHGWFSQSYSIPAHDVNDDFDDLEK